MTERFRKYIVYSVILIGVSLLSLKSAYGAGYYDQYQLPMTITITNKSDMHMSYDAASLSTQSSDPYTQVTVENHSSSSSIEGDAQPLKLYSYINGLTQNSSAYGNPGYNYGVVNITLQFFGVDGTPTGCHYTISCVSPVLVQTSPDSIYHCQNVYINAQAFGSDTNWLSSNNCQGNTKITTTTADITIQSKS